MGSTDWAQWHLAYGDPDSDLSRRRRSVQSSLTRWLDEAGPGPLRGVSACCGDGRDLLEVLATHDGGQRVQARLLELDPWLAERAERYAVAHGLSRVEVRQQDAGCTDSYAGAVPADLVMLCGVFGNLTDEDTLATIETTRQLAAHGATVVWTRGRFPERDPVEPTIAIREAFVDAGFENVSLDAPDDSVYRVGVQRYVGAAPEPLVPGRTFFTFTR